MFRFLLMDARLLDHLQAIGIAGILPQNKPASLLGGFKLALLELAFGKDSQGNRIRWIERERLMDTVQGLGRTVQQLQGQTSAGISGRQPRLDACGSGKGSQRCFKIPRAKFCPAQCQGNFAGADRKIERYAETFGGASKLSTKDFVRRLPGLGGLLQCLVGFGHKGQGAGAPRLEVAQVRTDCLR